jgi:chemotaxis receptor (MCP) glutamine deamidase CheD
MQTMAQQEERLISRHEMQALLSFDQLSLREDLARRGALARHLRSRLAGGAQSLLKAFGMGDRRSGGEQR